MFGWAALNVMVYTPALGFVTVKPVEPLERGTTAFELTIPAQWYKWLNKADLLTLISILAFFGSFASFRFK